MIRKRNNKTELVLLDHGLYQKLTEKDRVCLSYFWKCIVLNDHSEMKKYATQLGVKGAPYKNYAN